MIFVGGFCMAFVVLIILIILGLNIRYHGKKIADLKQQSIFKKVFAAALIVYGKCLYIPHIDIIIRVFKASTRMTLANMIITNVINVVHLIFYLIVVVYYTRLFKLNMPSEYCSWAGPNNQIMYLGLLAKVINPIILAIDKSGNYIDYEIIISLAI